MKNEYEEINVAWAENFIRNFNQVYEIEGQSFFIKICQGHHGQPWIAFIFHPLNSYPCGNHVCPVYVTHQHHLFLKDFNLGYKIIYEMNKEYLTKRDEYEQLRASQLSRLSTRSIYKGGVHRMHRQ